MNSVSTPPFRLSQVRKDVDKIMAQYCDEQILRAQSMSASYEQLWKTIKVYLLAGGKRLRPYLVVLTYQAYGGTDYESILKTAAAWELLHCCLLVHDDIIDRDYVRHGELNIAGIYEANYKLKVGPSEASHYAASSALLAGDLLLTAAYSFIMSSDFSDQAKVQAARLLDEAIFEVGGGELLDMEASLLPYGTVDPIQIAKQKTAHYSFFSPICVGATLAKAPEGSLQALKDYAMNVGLGFQLVDDMLGLYGDEVITGKSASSDLREGKHTVILDKIIKLGSSEQQTVLEKIVKSGNVSNDDVNTVRQMAKVTGAKMTVEQEIKVLKQAAKAALDQLNLAAEYRDEFAWVAAVALDRNS